MPVSILVLPESSMMTVACVVDPLRAANRLASTPVFAWRLLTPSGQPVTLTSGNRLSVDGPFPDAEAADVLIVVAGFDQARHASAETVRQVRRQARRARIVCGIEAGTWVLARAGLTDGHVVTTHWEDFESFIQAFPGIDLRHHRYVVDGRLWTCGGASPALDLMLELVRQAAGTATALDVASVFVHDEPQRPSELQPSVAARVLEPGDVRVSRAVRLMGQALDAPLAVHALARALGLSRRRLEQLFQAHLGESPGSYYLKLRLTQARKLCLDSALPIQEVAQRTGFASQSSFARAFRRRFGMSAAALRGGPPGRLRHGPGPASG